MALSEKYNTTAEVDAITFWLPLDLDDHVLSLFPLSLHDDTESLSCLVRSELIDQMVHVDEEHTQVLYLLLSLCNTHTIGLYDHMV